MSAGGPRQIGGGGGGGSEQEEEEAQQQDDPFEGAGAGSDVLRRQDRVGGGTSGGQDDSGGTGGGTGGGAGSGTGNGGNGGNGDGETDGPISGEQTGSDVRDRQDRVTDDEKGDPVADTPMDSDMRRRQDRVSQTEATAGDAEAERGGDPFEGRTSGADVMADQGTDVTALPQGAERRGVDGGPPKLVEDPTDAGSQPVEQGDEAGPWSSQVANRAREREQAILEENPELTAEDVAVSYNPSTGEYDVEATEALERKQRQQSEERVKQQLLEGRPGVDESDVVVEETDDGELVARFTSEAQGELQAEAEGRFRGRRRAVAEDTGEDPLVTEAREEQSEIETRLEGTFRGRRRAVAEDTGEDPVVEEAREAIADINATLEGRSRGRQRAVAADTGVDPLAQSAGGPATPPGQPSFGDFRQGEATTLDSGQRGGFDLPDVSSDVARAATAAVPLLGVAAGVAGRDPDSGDGQQTQQADLGDAAFVIPETIAGIDVPGGGERVEDVLNARAESLNEDIEGRAAVLTELSPAVQLERQVADQFGVNQRPTEDVTQSIYQGAGEGGNPFDAAVAGKEIGETGAFLLASRDLDTIIQRGERVGAQAGLVAGGVATAVRTDPVRFGASLVSSGIIGAKVSPVRVAKTRVPLEGGDEATLRAVQVTTPVTRSRTKTIAGARGLRPTRGAPTVDLQRVDIERTGAGKANVGDTFEPVAPFETEVFVKSARREGGEVEARIQSVEEILEFGDAAESGAVVEPIPDVIRSARDLPDDPQVAARITEALAETDAVIYGSGAVRAQAPEFRQPGDIDVVAPDPEATITALEEATRGARVSLGDDLEVKGPDAFAGLEAGEAFGFGRVSREPIMTESGVRVNPIAEELQRKAGGSGFFRGETVGGPGVDVGPRPVNLRDPDAPLRVKDIADTIDISRSVVRERGATTRQIEAIERFARTFEDEIVFREGANPGTFRAPETDPLLIDEATSSTRSGAVETPEGVLQFLADDRARGQLPGLLGGRSRTARQRPSTTATDETVAATLRQGEESVASPSPAPGAGSEATVIPGGIGMAGVDSPTAAVTQSSTPTRSVSQSPAAGGSISSFGSAAGSIVAATLATGSNVPSPGTTGSGPTTSPPITGDGPSSPPLVSPPPDSPPDSPPSPPTTSPPTSPPSSPPVISPPSSPPSPPGVPPGIAPPTTPDFEEPPERPPRRPRREGDKKKRKKRRQGAIFDFGEYQFEVDVGTPEEVTGRAASDDGPDLDDFLAF